MSAEELLPFLNYGVLGLLVLGLITNRLALPRERDREADRADKAEAERDALRARVEEQVIPLLTRATDLVSEAERRRAPRD